MRQNPGGHPPRLQSTNKKLSQDKLHCLPCSSTVQHSQSLKLLWHMRWGKHFPCMCVCVCVHAISICWLQSIWPSFLLSGRPAVLLKSAGRGAQVKHKARLPPASVLHWQLLHSALECNCFKTSWGFICIAIEVHVLQCNAGKYNNINTTKATLFWGEVGTLQQNTEGQGCSKKLMLWATQLQILGIYRIFCQILAIFFFVTKTVMTQSNTAICSSRLD